MLYIHLYIKHRIVLSYTLINTSSKRTCITNNNSYHLLVQQIHELARSSLLIKGSVRRRWRERSTELTPKT